MNNNNREFKVPPILPVDIPPGVETRVKHIETVCWSFVVVVVYMLVVVVVCSRWYKKRMGS